MHKYVLHIIIVYSCTYVQTYLFLVSSWNLLIDYAEILVYLLLVKFGIQFLISYIQILRYIKENGIIENGKNLNPQYIIHY